MRSVRMEIDLDAIIRSESDTSSKFQLAGAHRHGGWGAWGWIRKVYEGQGQDQKRGEYHA